MALQITYKAGVYEINGQLILQNGNTLKNHLEVLIDSSKGIVLSLNKVLDIDSNAAKDLAALYTKSWKNDKMFYIVGMKNKKVYELFSTLELNDILL